MQINKLELFENFSPQTFLGLNECLCLPAYCIITSMIRYNLFKKKRRLHFEKIYHPELESWHIFWCFTTGTYWMLNRGTIAPALIPGPYALQMTGAKHLAIKHLYFGVRNIVHVTVILCTFTAPVSILLQCFSCYCHKMCPAIGMILCKHKIKITFAIMTDQCTVRTDLCCCSLTSF